MVTKEKLWTWGFPAVLLILSFLMVLSLLFSKPLAEETVELLCPSWDSAEIEEIHIDRESLVLRPGNPNLFPRRQWLLKDQDNNLWPLDRSAVEELLNLPGQLEDHPVAHDIPEDSSWMRDSYKIQYLDSQGGEVFQLLVGQPDQRGGFFFQTDGRSLYRSNQSQPPGELRQLLGINPLPEFLPDRMILFQLHTDLEGTGSSQYRYSLVSGDNQWSIQPGNNPLVDTDTLALFALGLNSIEAMTVVNQAVLDLGEERFHIRIEDSRGQTWILRVGASVPLAGKNLWPVQLEGEPWVYLFEQQELQKMAPPLSYFTENLNS